MSQEIYKIGDVVHGYVLKKFLDKGANGNVFEASNGGVSYAMKLYKAESNAIEYETEKKLAHFVKDNGITNMAEWRADFPAGPMALVLQMGNRKQAVKRMDEMYWNLPNTVNGMLEMTKGLMTLHMFDYSHNDIAKRNVVVIGSELSLVDYGLAVITEKLDLDVMRKQVFAAKQYDTRLVTDTFFECFLGNYSYNNATSSEKTDEQKKASLRKSLAATNIGQFEQKVLMNMFEHGRLASRENEIMPTVIDLSTLRALIWAMKKPQFDRNCFPNEPAIREIYKCFLGNLSVKELIASKANFVHIPPGSSTFTVPLLDLEAGGFYTKSTIVAGPNQTLEEKSQLYRDVYSLFDLLDMSSMDVSYELDEAETTDDGESNA